VSLYPLCEPEIIKLNRLVLDRYAETTKGGKEYVPMTDEEITQLVEKATGRKAWSPKDGTGEKREYPD
jgi:hypothetical protein